MATTHEEASATQKMRDTEEEGISRRNFITGGGILTGSMLVGGLASGLANAEESGPSSSAISSASAGSSAADTETIAPAIGHINHISQICTGCQTCALVCALTHEGVINPKMARNVVKTDVQVGYITDVLYCQQCDDPRCMKACPTGALHVDENTGARVIDQDVCIGCQSCLNACMFAPSASRIKFNPVTNTCYKCDLCGGDPLCVKYCPLGASQASWVEYNPIVRPQIDDYVEETTAGAIEGVSFEKDYSGPHAGKAEDEKDWALVATDGGADVEGLITSSDGAELRVRMHCDFYDADGNLLGSSDEHQWCMTMHEDLAINFHYDIDDVSKISRVVLVANISYWVSTEDKEY